MTNTLSQNSTDNSLHVAGFSAVQSNPSDLHDIGQDLEITANDYIAGLPIDAGAEYEFNYQLTITRKKL